MKQSKLWGVVVKHLIAIIILVLGMTLSGCSEYQITYEEVNRIADYCEENDMWVVIVYDPLTWIRVDAYCQPR